MDPILPVAKVVALAPSTEVLLAVVLGFGFGFALEQGGLANPRVLAGQWFGYNFAVLRVMFTAIVVAMVGMFGLHYTGLLNFELVYVNPTYLWPQLVGGLLLGVGFGVGQHCPGTAAVACAVLNFDAMAYIGGFLAGAIGFAFLEPAISGFYNSSFMGRALLPEKLGLPTGVVVLGVVVMALGAFAFTHWLDKKLKNAEKPQAI
ncbi:MAG: YeeE/YedE thiosulfate transporter family protein [Myxococcales bacterium]